MQHRRRNGKYYVTHSPETEPAAATVKKEAATFISRCVVFGVRERRSNTGSGSPAQVIR